MIINVFGLKYNIIFSDDMASGDWGESQPTTQTIKVSNKLTPEQQNVTLMHELIHAVLSATVRDDAHKDIESMIRCISLGLCDIGYVLEHSKKGE